MVWRKPKEKPKRKAFKHEWICVCVICFCIYYYVLCLLLQPSGFQHLSTKQFVLILILSIEKKCRCVYSRKKHCFLNLIVFQCSHIFHSFWLESESISPHAMSSNWMACGADNLHSLFICRRLEGWPPTPLLSAVWLSYRLDDEHLQH